jgi:hypothetical protein
MKNVESGTRPRLTDEHLEGSMQIATTDTEYTDFVRIIIE